MIVTALSELLIDMNYILFSYLHDEILDQPEA